MAQTNIIRLAPGSLLGQLAPANTTAAAIFTATLNTEITRIQVCNVSGGAATYRIFHDVGGSTYAAANALWYDVSVATGAVAELLANSMYGGITLAATDSLGVRTSVNDALTFSVYGVVQDAR